MVSRALAGLIGAVVGLLPLIAVDAVVNNPASLGSLAPNSDQAPLLSLTAVVGGLLLGGALAGWIAGRKAGIGAAAAGGVVAALLYAGALIAVILLGAARSQQGLPYVQMHPVRSIAVVLLVASVMIVVALVAGWVVRPTKVAADAQPAYQVHPTGPRYPQQGPALRSPAAWPPPARAARPLSAPRPQHRKSATRTWR